MAMRSASATVCGNGLFNVSGNIKANTAAISETIPYTRTGKLLQTRAYFQEKMN